MIDFPASPTLNQLFTASNGAVYSWNGTVWVPVGVGGSAIALADTPPSNPVIGQLWWNSTLGQLFIWYDDGTSQQWVPANPVPTSVTPPIGSRIRCTFPSGGLPPGVASTVQFTVVSNDTGATPTTTTWVPPAGRWLISATVSFQNNIAGNSYCRLIPMVNGAAVATLHYRAFENGQVLAIPYNEIADFSGTDVLSWQCQPDAATTLFQPSSYWYAVRVK